jgi:hypothetical protein
MSPRTLTSKSLLRAACVLLALEVAACGKSGSSDDPESTDPATVNSGGGGGAATGTVAINLAALSSGAALGLTAVPTRSFTPVSYTVPIKALTLSEEASTAVGSQTGGGKPLYTCASDHEEDCRVDLLDAAAVKAAFGESASVAVGAYKAVGYAFACGTVPTRVNADGQGIHVGIKGTVEIGGTKYYTTSGAAVLTAVEADYGVAVIPIGGCGGKVFNLDQDLVVAAGVTTKVNLFLSAEDLGWASLSGGAANPAGCAYAGTDTAPTTGICTNLPPIVPAVGDLEVAMETYHVASAACGAGSVSFVVNQGSNVALGAFLSRYYDGANAASACWDAGVDLFKKNADDTYTIGADTTAPSNAPRVEFTAFQRAAHGGTLQHATGGSVLDDAYTATVAVP